MASGSLLPNLWTYALDPSGIAIPGSLLYFFAAGTSTPIDTFSDVALTTANANPVVADSAGRFGPIYVTPGLSYKAIWKTAAGATLRTLDNIPAIPTTASVPPVTNSVADLRLTLTSGLPVTPADVLAATSVYVEPYLGNRIALFDGVTWQLRSVTATAIAIPASANTLFDVFCYDNSGVPTFELVAWTNDTTRATALTTQDGVQVKSGAVTHRYLGTFRTTAVAGQTEDSAVKRYVWNAQHQVDRVLQRLETTATWTYTTATFHQANASALNQVEVVIGAPETLVRLHLQAVAANGAAGVNLQIGIGLDSVTVSSTIGTTVQTPIVNYRVPMACAYYGYPGIGRHYLAWLELSEATNTTTWSGTSSGARSGLTGVMQG